jgi:hypothetical protein
MLKYSFEAPDPPPQLIKNMIRNLNLRDTPKKGEMRVGRLHHFMISTLILFFVAIKQRI